MSERADRVRVATSRAAALLRRRDGVAHAVGLVSATALAGAVASFGSGDTGWFEATMLLSPLAVTAAAGLPIARRSGLWTAAAAVGVLWATVIAIAMTQTANCGAFDVARRCTSADVAKAAAGIAPVPLLAVAASRPAVWAARLVKAIARKVRT